MTINLEKVMSVTDFRKDVYGIVDQVVESDTPEVLTKKGQAVAVVVSAKSYQRLMQLADQALLQQHKEAVDLALEQARRGKTIDAQDAYQLISEKYGLPMESN